MGITIPALRVAGGLLLLLLSTGMIRARHSGIRTTADGEDRDAARKDDPSLFPVPVSRPLWSAED